MVRQSENRTKSLKSNTVLQASRIFRGSTSYRLVPQKPVHARKSSMFTKTVSIAISLTDQDWKILESVLEDESGPSESLLADVQCFKKNFS